MINLNPILQMETDHIVPIGVLCIILFVSLIVTMGVLHYVRKQKGESYYTQEDAGDFLGVDADTAVVHAKTGHKIEKKKEWIL